MSNLIILNPSSFKGKALEVRGEVESAFKNHGLEYEIHISKSSEDIISTVKTNLDNFSNFISLGGDGTLHHMANALAGTEKNLGCIPMGSGNDIAKNLDLPFELDGCCLAIKNCRVKTIDAIFLVAGNMAMYGGGMKIAPEADPTDGILDICIIKRMNKVHFIKTFPTVFQGQHLSDPFVEYFKVKSIEIDSEYKFSVFADGEYICKLPARYEVFPKALNFIVAS